MLHRSTNFLVVNKPHDLVMNSPDVDRASLHGILCEQESHLADKDKYTVRCLSVSALHTLQFCFQIHIGNINLMLRLLVLSLGC